MVKPCESHHSVDTLLLQFAMVVKANMRKDNLEQLGHVAGPNPKTAAKNELTLPKY